ncbi:MAG TPA: glycosyl hydrolase, partial [Vicinamibacteria bacterium]
MRPSRVMSALGRSLLVASLGSAATAAAPPAPAGTGPLDGLEWRNVGPANMGGRVADVEGVPGNPRVVYVGSASGGVWKTTNGGTTWKPLFDKEAVASIGDMATEPGNPDVIYVGTGESNVRNSVSFGNGVYKSTDGGASWKHLGLAGTERISRIVVSPHDPQRVYVAALGHAFGPHPERGVYMSRNGGESWDKVLYLDDKHGAADLDLDPQNPNILYAALWRFERKPWTHTSGSEAGGVWKSVDAGRTWTKLEKGLPKLLGRIAVKVAPSNPQVVYVLAESKEGTVFRSSDRGESFTEMSKDPNVVNRGFYYTDLRVDPTNEDRVYAVSSTLQVSLDGGKGWKRISRSTHVDFHSLWIDPRDPARMWQGQDGGVAVSYDRGESWEYANNFAIGQFYQVFADDAQPFYNLGGGMQDNGTWWGPSRSKEPAGILNDDWRMVNFGDGFFLVRHPEDPQLFLSEYQGGAIALTDMRTREQQEASPQPRRADGAPVSALKYRFNWNAPIVASPWDGKTVYFAGNVVFRSRDFGLSWETLSPDLTTNDPEKQKDAGGPVFTENTTAEYHCTVISFAESPKEKGVFWSGSDDGLVQLSRDDGKT